MQHTEGVVCSNIISGKPIHFFVGNRNDTIQRHHMFGEFYEQEELGIIARHFAPGSVFVDVGANVGNHSLFVGLFLDPAAIVPIEPNPAAIPLLRLNLLMNNLSAIVEEAMIGIGLSDSLENAVPFTASTNNIGGTKMQVTDTPGSIALFPGDFLFAEKSVDFVKIDVEGMEMRVLAGLAATISRCRPNLFVEVDDGNVPAFEMWLTENDYRLVERFRRYVGNENYMVTPRARRPQGVLATG